MLTDVIDRGQVDHLGTTSLDARQPFGHPVDADHAAPLVQGDPTGHVADRAEAQHEQCAALGHVGMIVASAATVGGALGSGLEWGEAIRAAANSKRKEERRNQLVRERK